jgi:hypothetical protein
MSANTLISRVSFHIPVPPAPLRRHKSILFLFWVVNLPNQSGESSWGNSDRGWVYMTEENCSDCLICSPWFGFVVCINTAWTSMLFTRHIYLDFINWTDLLALVLVNLLGASFVKQNVQLIRHFNTWKELKLIRKEFQCQIKDTLNDMFWRTKSLISM